MTGIITIRQTTKAVILSDAAMYDMSGRVKAFGAKCTPIPHLRAAVAARGSGLSTSLMAAELGARFSTFDEMVFDGDEAIQEIYDQNFEALERCGDHHIELYIAGISERSQTAQTYQFSSFARPDFPAWEYNDLDEIVAAPMPPADALGGMRFSVNLDRMDVVRDGVAMMQAQRDGTYPPASDGSGEPRHIIGGHVLMTTVSLEGVSQRVIHRWLTDRVGDFIRPFSDPETGDGVAIAPPERLTRQQRREAEALAKKKR